MNISKIQNISPILFRGYIGNTKNTNSNIKEVECKHESHFMRNLETLDFVADYVKKEFPQGTHIADYGCSNGEETYSLGILLHDENKDKKYKITGYDVAPEVIKDAKVGLYSISYFFNNYEKFLINKASQYMSKVFDKNIVPKQQQIVKNFEECFEPMPKDWESFNIHHPRYKKKVKHLVKHGQDIELITRRLEYFHQENGRMKKTGSYFIPKDKVFDNVVNFETRDITDIDKNLASKNTGVVIFKNALYHLIGSRINDFSKYDKIDITPAKELFKKVNSILPDGGLFVLGILGHDHLHGGVYTEYREIFQNGEKIKVFDTSPIHKALREAGFEPVFYECKKTRDDEYVNLSVYAPSVWKKLSKEEIYQREQEQKKKNMLK